MQTCAIIEADQGSAAILRHYLWHISFLEISWSASSIQQVMDQNNSTLVDLLFVSVNDEDILQTNLANQLLTLGKQIIIILPVAETEIEQYLNKMLSQTPVMAYLKKPLTFEVFLQAMESFASF
ncbi:hypothetical protein QNI16_34275 [Cytophagaceae bacterium YF14B1]|uniref:Uncharacterized protein n=1 Tax=Xanthocytophaga flava TaxID=3048013 RepID=A0AAE3QY53_9BACT|nr:hypothetical protein [Xanthocytophaga flavus]MDJ1485608.1 hypothetical protein [Xanthocytophaga flavus]